MKLIQGDCTEIMLALDKNSVDTIITDPPYGLNFMGKDWDNYGDNEKFQEWTRRWAVQALRIAKPGAFMFCFGGTRTFHRIMCGIEDAGWEIRDTMGWLHGQGFPKSHNIALGHERGLCYNKKGVWYYKSDNVPMRRMPPFRSPEANEWWGWGTALKPAWEPIIVAMKPCENTYVENALKWGVAGLNIDGGRVPTGDDTTTRHNSSSSYMTQAIGEVQPKQDEYITGSNKGRWPANIIHDGSEEVVELFPNSSGGHYAGSPPGFQTGPRKRDVSLDRYSGDSGSAARFFYCAKASKAERNAGLEGMEEMQTTGGGGITSPLREDGSVIVSGDKGTAGKYGSAKAKASNNHPTVKPLSLMEYLCRLSATPTGGIVLDPFMGSGTTGMACKKVGRDFIGIELDPHYFEIAEKRIASVIQQELI